MRRASPWIRAAATATFGLLSACGGGGGGGGGGAYLTADPRGTSLGGLDPLEAAGAAAPSDAASGFASDLAREIEEADVYRVDGDRLVLLNAHRGLTVVDLESVEVESRTPLGGFPHEMFLRGDRVLALHADGDGAARLTVLSLAAPGAPVVEGTFPLGGLYVASRLVGDVLLVVTDGAVASFGVAGAVTALDSATLPHGASSVHAAPGLLVVAGGWDGAGTSVDLVDVSDAAGDVVLRGGVVAPGFVADEWKMHVAGDVLRVVAHDAVDGGLSRLVTFDVSDPDAPLPLGALDLARGEQLFATRFTDDVAYLVTFERVDPLWVVDLRDPTAPAVAGELVVPGWSTHLVPVGSRLVAVGVDPADGWEVHASLFDVSDPANPALLDREDFGWGWSAAFSDVKALGVFESDGLVTLPISGEGDRVAVLELGAASLDLRGSIAVDGTALRGFPHGTEIVALSTEEVVVADAATLVVRARATIAENVVDAMRLPDGRLLSLLAKSASGRLGDLDLPCVPTELHPRGARAAVLGWDVDGPCAYVADFSGPTATLSERFALGSPGWGPVDVLPMLAPDGGFGGFPSSAVLTDGGRLVVRGVPGADPWAEDGFVVLDVDDATLEPPVLLGARTVSGFAVDGERLAVTVGEAADPDDEGRPRMAHELVLVDLATGDATSPTPVPGWAVAAVGGLVVLVDEQWEEDWTWSARVVAVQPAPDGSAPAVDALPLPAGAYDLRAAGSTLFFTTVAFDAGGGGVGGGGGVAVPPGAPSEEWAPPTTTLGTVRLGADLTLGASIETEAFLTLLLPEDGSALVVRDGLRVERWDLSGPTASLDFAVDAGAYPLRARADLLPGAYLVALGYGGLLEAP